MRGSLVDIDCLFHSHSFAGLRNVDKCLSFCCDEVGSGCRISKKGHALETLNRLMKGKIILGKN